MASMINSINKIIFSILIPSIVFFLLVPSIITVKLINQNSMMPTLYNNQPIIFINKKSIFFHSPKDGDIITFTPPNEKITAIKRVVLSPGDYITWEDDKIKIKNYPYSIPVSFEQYLELSDMKRVPKGYYFVIGDNLKNSRDSRYYGLIPSERIKGVVILH